jgi:L-ascorbate metabolism protein UlaG (beta-lactamase superfamily)
MDNTTSPCIDAANLDDPLGHEPIPNGIIVNMGAYGSTAQASRTYMETLAQGQLRVTYIANEGFLLESQNKRVLIDALFNYDEDLYDFPSDTLREHITLGHGPFSPIDCYFVTHQHRDHFYAPYVALFLQHHPESLFVSAQQVVDLFDMDINDIQEQIVGMPLALGETIEQTFNGIETRATRMRHVGDNTDNGAHNIVYLMNLDGIKVLHVGDTIIPWETARFNAMNLQQEDVNVVFLESFDTYGVSRNFVNNVINPEYIIGMHFRRDNQRISEINTFRQAYPDGIIFEYPLQSQILTARKNSGR